jgi:hypothetical protein
MNPFDYINAINSGRDIMEDPDNPKLMEDGYSPWYANKSFSYFKETVLYANEMNLNANLDNKMQFYYLLNSIRPAKRFAKWVKKQDSNDLDVVKEYFGYSNEKAAQVLDILSIEQIHTIKLKLQKGG